MRLTKLLLISSLMLIVIALAASGVMADSRINQVHHFGGDVLYCTQEDGCWFVNLHGEPLWAVEQSDIADAVSAACDSGEVQVIEAGNGTYGPSQLVVGCPDSITLVGYDEWGKQNTMQFSTAYQPVNPAPSGDPTQCDVDLAGYGFMSVDRIHNEVGWDVWSTDKSLRLGEFLYWTPNDPGLPDCFVGIA